ncbi:CCR4-Not complex component, Not1, C-terminal [Artemisia annua]|uniref:CCR4-Not complex component, Not1, C-terminal n=1 Tax=Artemisia annua TaxID=35608 RepID=A0A2U1NDZ8_ARTAN|nr:CCR4-Not complex component, Not1, C-terminal [Artemisia annua]
MVTTLSCQNNAGCKPLEHCAFLASLNRSGTVVSYAKVNQVTGDMPKISNVRHVCEKFNDWITLQEDVDTWLSRHNHGDNRNAGCKPLEHCAFLASVNEVCFRGLVSSTTTEVTARRLRKNFLADKSGLDNMCDHCFFYGFWFDTLDVQSEKLLRFEKHPFGTCSCSLFGKLLGKPQFSTVFSLSIRPTSVTEEFLDNLSVALQLSAYEKLGFGLALTDSENNDIRMAG